MKTLSALLLANFLAPTATDLPTPIAVECTKHAATAAEGERADNKKLVKALREWLKLYLKGKFDIASGADITKTSVAKKHGVLKRGLLGALTRVREMRLMLDQGMPQADEALVEITLEIAAVGLDGRPYTVKDQPHLVREAAEQALAAVKSAKAKAHILALASGTASVKDRKRREAVRAAAVRALGHLGEPAFRPTLEQQLSADNSHVRIAAAQGLLKMKPVPSLEPLATAIEKEGNERALEAMVNACFAIMMEFAEKPDLMPRSGLHAVHASIGALGRTGWRADMAVIHLLEKFRNADAIPQLIKVLERFLNRPEDVKSGKLSGLLQHRTHEVLVSLTGALYPMDRPDQWLEFWNREKAGFQVAKARQVKTEGEGGTVSSGFFGIPVQGTRVMFVLDISGSMAWPMPVRGGGTTTGGSSPAKTSRQRWEAARDEVKKAVKALSPLASFNVVVFNDKVKVWQKDLVPADDKTKARFFKYVDGIRPIQGTNLYGGMQSGLKMKSLVWSDRYETHVDELFLMSDGAPSVGDVTDMHEILRLVSETNRWAKVRINTVFITSESQQPQQGAMPTSKFMERLATENGGKCVVIK